MHHFDSDRLGSSDIEEVLEISRQNLTASGSGRVVNHASNRSSRNVSSNKTNHSMVPVIDLAHKSSSSTLVSLNLSSNATQPSGSNVPSYVRKQELNARLSSLDIELQGIDEDIKKLKELRSKLVGERQELLKQFDGNKGGQRDVGSKGHTSTNGFSSGPGKTNYMEERFEWSGELKRRLKEVFSIESFRLCQEGVCNANMDGRDIVCVMPTGGGKSLTYQLPALLNPGCTLVISPLISLITDQILHLREFGIEAVMLTGTTTKDESRNIFNRMSEMAGVKKRGPAIRAADIHANEPEIKLCYVTPEKIAKSKTFVSMLEKLASAGRLARIVIDEAHCVSQLGHDFRPDYKKLSILRQLFPRVPILALSATCPPKVLKDLLLTLRMKGAVDGNAADRDGTVYFSAPLYRKNLHYVVQAKPASASAAIQVMADYILANHASDSGIVYCFSKKDSESVAEGLMTASEGKIRTGVYHADVNDGEKERLHHLWREGKVKVVCATIAFGLGIDKGDVRFVLHHSISKSLDGYYQESGRAGRDGKDAACVLYYRPQDASRVSAIVCGEREGQDKLHDMLRFAHDVEECRKILFAKYFSSSASLSMSSWATSESNALDRCGHCDNCTRSPDSIEHINVTTMAWRILKVTEAIERDSGRVTLGMLGDLVRGSGGGTYGVAGGGKRGKGKAKEKVDLDLEAIAGGKVNLTKDDTETLLMQLLLTGYLKESFHSTAYAINVYVVPGDNALRLSRWSREDIESGKAPKSTLALVKKSARRDGGVRGVNRRAIGASNTQSRSTKVNDRKGKKSAKAEDEDGERGDEDSMYLEDEVVDTDWAGRPKGGIGRRNSHKRRRIQSPTSTDGDESSETVGWMFSMSKEIESSKRARGEPSGAAHGKRQNDSGAVVVSDVEVIELSE